MSIKILTISVLISLSANLFASDFAYKFCTPDKASSVEVRSNGSTVQVDISAPGGVKLSMEETIIDEVVLTSENNKDILSVFSEVSGRNIVSGIAYGLLSSNGYSTHVEFIGTDSNGDINLLGVRGTRDAQSVDYIGSVNSCN